MQDAKLADSLWHATGLDRVCVPLRMGARRPIGLNPNIRLYRCTTEHCCPVRTFLHVRSSVCNTVAHQQMLAIDFDHRYKGSSQHFGPHVDEAVELGGGAATAYTLLIYLSGGLTGGETVFYGEHLC